MKCAHVLFFFSVLLPVQEEVMEVHDKVEKITVAALMLRVAGL